MRAQLLLFVFSFASFGAFSQSPISFGVRAGITSSGMSGDAVNNFKSLLDFTNGSIATKNHTGFFGGGFVSIPISETVSIEPALYYAQKGYDLQGQLAIKGADFLGAKAKANLLTQYVDLPVLVKANLGGFQVFAGPQVSYLANANLKTSAGVLGFNLLRFNTDATSQFNRWDAALTGGIGYEFSNGVNVMASYDQGLSKADANRSLSTYNHSVKVGIGMKF